MTGYSRASEHGADAHLGMIIDRRHVDAVRSDRYPILNPATGALVGTAPLGRAEDAARAIESARTALPTWRETPVHTRADLIERGLAAVSDCALGLAALLTREQGKPLTESVAEIASFVARMRSFVRMARSTSDGRIPMLASMRANPDAEPTEPGTGVTIGLVAWNFPIGLLAKKIGPALLAGGTVIIKPAFTTPLTTLRVVDLMNATGLPAGVLNCVTGRGDDIGAALVAGPAVARVYLSGSDVTGNGIKKATKATRPALVLDLGGSDPMIVCRDADLPKALQAAVVGRFRNAGQVCVAVKRLYVASEIYDAFVTELSALIRLRQPGNGLVQADPPSVRMGPLHTSADRDRVEEQLNDALRNGAEVLVGGCRPGGSGVPDGHFFEPTLVGNVPVQSKLVTEEVFGPVLPVFRTRGLEDAIEQANQSPWHLTASIWTADYETARRVTPRIRCRRLWINRLSFGFEQAT